VDRLDHGGLGRRVAERLPEDANGFGQRRLADEGLLPDGVDQLLLGHDAVGALEQILENGQRPGRKADLLAVARQRAIERVEAKRPEDEGPPRRGAMESDVRGRILVAHVMAILAGSPRGRPAAA
jgi:hypothetical protein